MTAWNWTKGLGLALVAAACSSNSTSQGWDEPQRKNRSDGAYESLIQRLELGAEALADLGRVDTLEQVLQVTDAVRAERASAQAARDDDYIRAARDQEPEEREENDEIREVRRRIAVMRHAVDAYVEVGDLAAAERVERAMHTRELAIAGRREEAAELRAQGPNRGELSELLAKAAQLHGDWNHPDRADMLMGLSTVYLDQWHRKLIGQAQGRGEGERRQEEEQHRRGASERVPATALEEREARIAVLSWAHAAQAEAGHPENADRIVQMLHVGRLQQNDADDDRIAQASEGLSMGLAIEILQSSANLYHEWGLHGRAESCTDLAEFYARRTREEQPEARPQEAGARREEARPREAGRPRGPASPADGFEAALERISHRLDSLERNLVELERIQRNRK